ncbi:2-polyprenyl-3-methyl-5-hydroxy-6-metoxy-1,4-benzoquinol methylase [Thermocatellispora tengchongensis]|uniref:2-polyprenyl-3-methyl-5-hydroxy-6-metoxy-1, 4-benzoquinol methylase n=1 Tax=Thermocatellispora tengchongensis TaxID=1073253 RepID=A0A840NZZ5_9ACTN|nr:class I SAM-dependent methyltransferase [Thermocatellispora tengchongensis]MBB5131263.1 2-polyprenyl-3-methyl-5-hydroxy-6-metoxy-1,4-benzoquinol methylase [Thermocatellispora tengchongensis]
MVSAKRIIARAVFGHRYDRVPWGQRVYVRPGERYAREAQWWLRLRRAPVLSLEEYQARVPLGEIEEFISCHLCGESRQQPLFRPAAQKDNGKTRWSYRVVRCPSCGFLYRNPNVRPERLGDLYATNYSGFLTGSYAQNRQRRYRLTMSAFSPVFDDGTGRRLLDFGCGAGLFLELAEQRGFDACGVDLSPDSVAEANRRLTKARAYFGAPEDVEEVARGGFDAITLWSVLAHLPRPLDDFTRFRGLLGPGGVLLILTVNAGSLLLKAYGSAWSGFTKNHLMFYSAKTLPVLLRRTGFAGVAFAPFFGDTVEEGTTRLSPAYARRLRRTVIASDGGNMMRALAFADEEAIARWGSGLAVQRL